MHIISTVAVVYCRHSQKGAIDILNDVIATEAVLVLTPRSVKENIIFGL